VPVAQPFFLITNFHFSQHYAKAEQKLARLSKGKFWMQLFESRKTEAYSG
jgi:hypothetical protein